MSPATKFVLFALYDDSVDRMAFIYKKLLPQVNWSDIGVLWQQMGISYCKHFQLGTKEFVSVTVFIENGVIV